MVKHYSLKSPIKEKNENFDNLNKKMYFNVNHKWNYSLNFNFTNKFTLK